MKNGNLEKKTLSFIWFIEGAEQEKNTCDIVYLVIKIIFLIKIRLILEFQKLRKNHESPFITFNHLPLLY